MTPAKILGLTTSQAADPDAVRRAYIRMLKRHRPDQDPGGFQRLRDAYVALRDPVAPGWGAADPAPVVDGSPIRPPSPPPSRVDWGPIGSRLNTAAALRPGAERARAFAAALAALHQALDEDPNEARWNAFIEPHGELAALALAAVPVPEATLLRLAEHGTGQVIGRQTAAWFGVGDWNRLHGFARAWRARVASEDIATPSGRETSVTLAAWIAAVDHRLATQLADHAEEGRPRHVQDQRSAELDQGLLIGQGMSEAPWAVRVRIADLVQRGVAITDRAQQAEVWAALDHLPATHPLRFHVAQRLAVAATGKEWDVWTVAMALLGLAGVIGGCFAMGWANSRGHEGLGWLLLALGLGIAVAAWKIHKRAARWWYLKAGPRIEVAYGPLDRYLALWLAWTWSMGVPMVMLTAGLSGWWAALLLPVGGALTVLARHWLHRWCVPGAQGWRRLLPPRISLFNEMHTAAGEVDAALFVLWLIAGSPVILVAGLWSFGVGRWMFEAWPNQGFPATAIGFACALLMLSWAGRWWRHWTTDPRRSWVAGSYWAAAVVVSWVLASGASYQAAPIVGLVTFIGVGLGAMMAAGGMWLWWRTPAPQEEGQQQQKKKWGSTRRPRSCSGLAKVRLRIVKLYNKLNYFPA